MAEAIERETPMGRVWFVVFMTICFTLAASWIWHMSEMKAVERRYQAENDAIIAETARIAEYHAVLKEGGKEAADAYLTALSPEKNGTE